MQEDVRMWRFYGEKDETQVDDRIINTNMETRVSKDGTRVRKCGLSSSSLRWI